MLQDQFGGNNYTGAYFIIRLILKLFQTFTQALISLYRFKCKLQISSFESCLYNNQTIETWKQNRADLTSTLKNRNRNTKSNSPLTHVLLGTQQPSLSCYQNPEFHLEQSYKHTSITVTITTLPNSKQKKKHSCDEKRFKLWPLYL